MLYILVFVPKSVFLSFFYHLFLLFWCIAAGVCVCVSVRICGLIFIYVISFKALSVFINKQKAHLQYLLIVLEMGFVYFQLIVYKYEKILILLLLTEVSNCPPGFFNRLQSNRENKFGDTTDENGIHLDFWFSISQHCLSLAMEYSHLHLFAYQKRKYYEL